MESVKVLVSYVVQIITGTLGSSGFYSSILLIPFVLWFMRQIIIMFKRIFGSL